MFEQIIHRVVKVHCGSAHVRGNARRYPYYVASLFEAAVTADGRYVYRNAGLVCGPYRSRRKCSVEACAWTADNNAEFVVGYGSLHHQPVLTTRTAVAVAARAS